MIAHADLQIQGFIRALFSTALWPHSFARVERRVGESQIGLSPSEYFCLKTSYPNTLPLLRATIDARLAILSHLSLRHHEQVLQRTYVGRVTRDLLSQVTRGNYESALREAGRECLELITESWREIFLPRWKQEKV